jgi:hypothetical protein
MMENKIHVVWYTSGSKDEAILVAASDAEAARAKARPILAVAKPGAVMTNAYETDYAIVLDKHLELPAVVRMTANTDPQEPQHDIGPDEL